MTAMRHFSLTPMQLARAEYDRAYRELLADRDAGTISPADASAKFTDLLAGYHAKKEELWFSSFVRSHGIENVFGMEG